MVPRPFPNPVAVFDDRFLFTTLNPKEVLSHGKASFCHPQTESPCVIFSLDEEMRYSPFAMDHGPLNLAFTFHACMKIHEKLQARSYRHKPLCLYTSPKAKNKSNMALMAALYYLIVAHEGPWSAFKPIAEMELMPFRDAGNGPMDYGMSIQDCLYGVRKAIDTGLLDLAKFDPKTYEYYETVENGDLNVLGPFIPFASPSETEWIQASVATQTVASPSGFSKTTTTRISRAKVIPHGFKCVLDICQTENVGLVVRLNDELYDRRHFLDMGIDHVEMYFDDGSNPSDEIVRDFIQLALEAIEGRGKKVGVHCRAGLGRTGVLIGAYLIYKYGFSAQEVIGYMRIVRPGMVVGPQQQYMVMNQMKWVGWAARDALLQELEEERMEVINPLATPPAEYDEILPSPRHPLRTSRQACGVEIGQASRTPPNKTLSQLRPLDSPHKGGDAVGQPRKTPARSFHVEIQRPELGILIEPASPTLIRPSALDTVNVREPPALTSSTPPPSGVGPMRSRKLRLRLPRTSSSIQALTPPDQLLQIPPAFHRSLSTSSMISRASEQDQRPIKRRPGTSSSLSDTGLSSPPPSRDSSPAFEENIEGAPIASSLTILTKHRRRISRDETDETISPPATAAQKLGDAPTAIKDRASNPLPVRRSFLPVMRHASPLKDIRPINKGQVTRRSAEMHAPVSVVASSPRKTGLPKRIGLTPPRSTSDIFGSFSR